MDTGQDGYRTGADKGQGQKQDGQIQDRGRYRTGADTGQGQIQDRGRYRTGADI